MSKHLLIFLFSLIGTVGLHAQINSIDPSGEITTRDQNRSMGDSLGSDKEIPVGIKVWTVDERFGDRREAQVDTLPHMFPNTIFTTGMRGEYNSTGNLGAPRINRIFIDRQNTESQFLFTQPYDFVIKAPQDFHFTNTLSPFTNLTYNSCGDRTVGENHLTARFGVNAGKRIGAGFLFDYLYGRGYYSSQSTSHFNFTLYGSYLGDRYEAHLLFSNNHQKVTENGGITDDDYITHPERFSDNYQSSEIPTALSYNWNRNDNQHVLFTHRYSVGFNRKVPMTAEEIEARKFAIAAKKDEEARKAREEAERKAEEEGRDYVEGSEEKPQPTFAGRPDDAKIAGVEPDAPAIDKGDRIAVGSKEVADSLLAQQKKAEEDTTWLKNEYVPVTSFVHTLNFDNYKRIYQAYETPTNYYADTFDVPWRFDGDSIYDETRHYELRNTVAISMLEGFNKWAKAGLKAFAASDLRHFSLPDTTGNSLSYNEHSFSVGGQLIKAQGKTLHYSALGEFWLVGKDAGQLKIDATADVNFPLFGDTVTLAAKGFFHRLVPTFYYRHYHAKHFWWDNDDLSKIIHTRVEGTLSYQKTRTKLRVAFDEIKNHTYFAYSYTVGSDLLHTANAINVRQESSPITLITAALSQDFTLGPVNWETVATFQHSTNESALPVPKLNIYSNIFLRFKIAKVLKCDFGADVRFFTKYYAPDYCPALGQFAVQEDLSETTTETTTDSETPSRMVKTGNYPFVNVYANFHLKRTRFFIMMSHVNAGTGKKDYFLTPHYPTNGRILRLGLSWNFFN
ncbi:MAG: putative porin [Prevotella sp.]|nr:putative porin [Prevotella sp.]